MARSALDHRSMPRNTSNSPIAKARIDHGITQQKLADMLGTTQQQITRWERGLYAPDEETLQKIADILNVDIEDIRPIDPDDCVTKYQIRVRNGSGGDDPMWPDAPLIEDRTQAHDDLIKARTVLRTVNGILNDRIVFIQSYICHNDTIIKLSQRYFDIT